MSLNLFSQTPIITTDSKTEQPMLIGLSQRSDYEKGEGFKEWFKEEYDHYHLDEKTLSIISESVDDFQIECFMGTWCKDSRREVPRMYKILDFLKYDERQLTMISVDRNRTSPGEEEKGKNIHHVPTIIFYKEGQEISRIIESPTGSLEADFVDILLGNPPVPNYSDGDTANEN